MQTDIEHCDWNAAWRTAHDAGSLSCKDKAFWNHRAASFASHANHKSDYPQQFLNIVRPRSHWRVLDLGCGPGTVAIPMAPLVSQITALDFSDRMLAILQDRCAEKKIAHIKPVQADWTDDWQALGIEPHDLVMASRSFSPADLEETIAKMNRYATCQVCISAPVGTGPFDRRIMAAAGRAFRPGPDYIYILNQLHRMKIYARLAFTIHPVNRTYADHREALDECRWMIPDMTSEEQNRLLDFFEKNLIRHDNRWHLPGTPVVRWAVIIWDVPQDKTPGWEEKEK